MNNVLIVGTGTIGEPLIGLLTSVKDQVGIGNVYFYKRTPLKDEVAKVNDMCRRGAKLVVKDDDIAEQFQALGHQVSMNFVGALEIAGVVIDCTPAGNENKELFYSRISDYKDMKAGARPPVFIAQGSEKGFGMPYAYRINDDAMLAQGPRFIQVVSCNTHNITSLLKVMSDDFSGIVDADFVCIRRANDISQVGGFIASPQVGSHKSAQYGSHHTMDAVDLIGTLGKKLKLYSSAMKLNTQYMHTIRFQIKLKGEYSYDDILKKLSDNRMVCLSEKTDANRIFSFGRDHGYYGRIYNQTVISIPTLSVRNTSSGTIITGFCFTPQDGNSLLSSTAAILYGLYGDDFLERMSTFDDMLFDYI